MPGMPGLNQQQMQLLFSHMGEIQQCMGELGPAGMNLLQEKSKQIQRETRTLCEQGKRDEALRHVSRRSKALMSDPRFAKAKNCSTNLWDQLAQPWLAQQQGGAHNGQHVCDMIARADQRGRAQPVAPVVSRPLPPTSPKAPRMDQAPTQY